MCDFHAVLHNRTETLIYDCASMCLFDVVTIKIGREILLHFLFTHTMSLLNRFSHWKIIWNYVKRCDAIQSLIIFLNSNGQIGICAERSEENHCQFHVKNYKNLHIHRIYLGRVCWRLIKCIESGVKLQKCADVVVVVEDDDGNGRNGGRDPRGTENWKKEKNIESVQSVRWHRKKKRTDDIGDRRRVPGKSVADAVNKLLIYY